MTIAILERAVGALVGYLSESIFVYSISQVGEVKIEFKEAALRRGKAGRAPNLVVVSAAATLANRTASSSERPRCAQPPTRQ